MGVRGTVTAVMVDTVDVDLAVAFWTDILGLELVHRTETYAYLSPISADGPHLAFQEVAEAKMVKNRLHLDVRVDDREAFAERIVSMGGTKLRDVQEDQFPPWTIMTDPLGNEFCIYEPSSA